MGRRHDKFRQMLAFLKQMERSQQPFTLEEMAQSTGYKDSSIRTYYGKRLKQVLVSETSDGRYRAHGLDVFEPQTFIDYMTQRNAPSEQIELPGEFAQVEPVLARSPQERLSDALLERAAQSFTLALRTLQDHPQPGRLGSFGQLLWRAWSLLLMAQMARIEGMDGVYAQDEPFKSKSFKQLLGEIFTDPHDPVRRNLYWLHVLTQDNASLLFDQFHAHLSRLLQASVFNFRKRFEALAGRRLALWSVGALVVISDEPATSFDEVRQSLGDFVATRMHHLLLELRTEEAQLKNHMFCVEPGWSLSLYHPALRQTVALVEGNGPLDALQQLDAPQDTQPYPFEPVDAVGQINHLLGYASRISAQAIDVVDRVYRVRDNTPNRYADVVDGEVMYSRAYVHWIARSIRKDKEWLERTKQMYMKR